MAYDFTSNQAAKQSEDCGQLSCLCDVKSYAMTRESVMYTPMLSAVYSLRTNVNSPLFLVHYHCLLSAIHCTQDARGPWPALYPCKPNI